MEEKKKVKHSEYCRQEAQNARGDGYYELVWVCVKGCK
jgi:hypothetical protein